MKKTNQILSCILAFILVLSLSIPAFAFTPENNPYVDRHTILGSDLSITWDAVEPRGNYDMCIYPTNSGSPTYVKFNDTDVSTMGRKYHISGKFLKAAIEERAKQDNLTGVNTFCLRINEITSSRDQLIDYSFFKIDLRTMRLDGGLFTEIKTINLIFDLTNVNHPITTDTPHVKIDSVWDYDTGDSFLSIYTAGTHTLRILVLADEGYAFDGGSQVTSQGKQITVTDTNMWANRGNITFEIELEKDEVHGKAPSFFERFFAAIRDFLNRITYFFRNIFQRPMAV